MTWLQFCKLFTTLNLILIALATLVALIIAIAWLIITISDFIKKIKLYHEDYDILKDRFIRLDCDTYNSLKDLEEDIRKLKQGSKKKCK